MIRYALACDAGHGFDSWFRDSDAYERQVAAGLVTCPNCGSVKVAKQIMAPAVANRETEASVPVTLAEHHQQDQAHAMREAIRAFRQLVEANTDDVGKAFAEEARKIHFGEVEHRAIRGEATPNEIRELHEEGVRVAPLPILPDERN